MNMKNDKDVDNFNIKMKNMKFFVESYENLQKIIVSFLREITFYSTGNRVKFMF